MAAWREVLAGAEREPVPGGPRLTLPAARAGNLAELGATGQRCCPFFDFRLHLAGAGAVALGLYGFVATLQPDADFGRILAAYGGIFVAGSLAGLSATVSDHAWCARSLASFTLRDVAFTFVALVLALSTGLAQRETWLVVALVTGLLLAVLIVDTPLSPAPVRTVKITLDRVYAVPGEIRADVAARFGRDPLVVVDEVDYVRETTRVSARFAVDPAEDIRLPEAGEPIAGSAAGRPNPDDDTAGERITS